MAIGYPITKVDLDNRMGGMVVALRGALLAPVQFKANYLDDATMGNDAALQALGYTGSVSSLEIQQIRNAFTAMKLLSDVAHGLSTVPSLVDFFFDAKHLLGLNVNN